MKRLIIIQFVLKMNAIHFLHHPRPPTHESPTKDGKIRLKILCPFTKGAPRRGGDFKILHRKRFPSFKWRRKKRRQPKIFHLSDCTEITDINMLKLSNRIGCNDSPFSQVNQQTESMTEKFFERALFPRLFQLNCGKSRAWGLGTEYPKIQHKKILRPSGTSFQ